MLLALLALALIALVLATPMIVRETGRRQARRRDKRAAARDGLDLPLYDPGRERRAEQRARELLRSCVNAEEWAMYRDLGFIRVAAGVLAGDSDEAEVAVHRPLLGVDARAQQLAGALLGAALAAGVVELQVEVGGVLGAPGRAEGAPVSNAAGDHRRGQHGCDECEREQCEQHGLGPSRRRRAGRRSRAPSRAGCRRTP